MAYVNAPRGVIMVTREIDQTTGKPTGRSIFKVEASNIGPRSAHAFKMVPQIYPKFEKQGYKMWVNQWDGPVSMEADQMPDMRQARKEQLDDKAQTFVANLLKERPGGVEIKEIVSLAKERTLSQDRIERALKAIGATQSGGRRGHPSKWSL